MGRLIDADSLIENLRGYKTVYGVPMTKRDEQMVHWVIGHIKNLEPTSYDVEKVVEQLLEREETSKECYVEAMVEGIYSSMNRFCGERFAYNDAIELVRKGGVE